MLQFQKSKICNVRNFQTCKNSRSKDFLTSIEHFENLKFEKHVFFIFNFKMSRLQFGAFQSLCLIPIAFTYILMHLAITCSSFPLSGLVGVGWVRGAPQERELRRNADRKWRPPPLSFFCCGLLLVACLDEKRQRRRRVVLWFFWWVWRWVWLLLTCFSLLSCSPCFSFRSSFVH